MHEKESVMVVRCEASDASFVTPNSYPRDGIFNPHPTTIIDSSEPPIICYKYNKPIRNTVFTFNKLVSDLDIHANTPES